MTLSFFFQLLELNAFLGNHLDLSSLQFLFINTFHSFLYYFTQQPYSSSWSLSSSSKCKSYFVLLGIQLTDSGLLFMVISINGTVNFCVILIFNNLSFTNERDLDLSCINFPLNNIFCLLNLPFWFNLVLSYFIQDES